MRAFGFSEKLVDMIYRLNNNTWYSIKVQNQIFGFFRGGCGLRQGDPISPALFTLVMDVFSRNLKLRMEQGIIQKFLCSRRVPAVSHLLFADDILLFTNGNVRSVKNIKKLFEDFCKASGQVINKEKSRFFIQERTLLTQVRKIQQELQFHKGSFPTLYLGVPLFYGRAKAAHFDFILDKIRRRITGWKAKLLSWGGKISIITSILNSIPIYALSVLPAPKKAIENIQRSIADFIWNQGDQRRLHWVAWRRVAKPIEEGGLNLKLLAEASLYWKSKLAWSYLENKSLWSGFMNQKYKRDSVTMLDSKLWKDLVPLISDLHADSFWRIGKGKIYFWSQKWWPMEIFVNQQADLPDITFAEVWNDGRKKEVYLAALPVEIQQFAMNVQLDATEDQLVWKNSDYGVFSSKEFRLQNSVSAEDRCSWWKKFWQPWIPTKISCFIWKCLNHAVPVDEAVQKAKIPLVSKCVCCSVGHQETLHHLLLEGDVAKTVWRFLQGLFDVHSYYPSFHQAASLWIQHSSTNSQWGCLRILAFAVAIWEIWKWRNKVIYDHPEDPKYIRKRIVFQLQQYNALIVPGRDASWFEELAINSLHIPCVKAKCRKGKWVKWRANPDDFTVNIHGRTKDNMLQGSFVVRNCSGQVSGCFCRNFGEGKKMFQVLILILLEAITFVQNSGQRIAEIQIDDGNFFDCLKGKRSPPWRWVSQVMDLRRSCDGSVLKRLELEGNLVAVLAASIELDNQSSQKDVHVRPDIRKALLEDSIGLERWSWG